MNYKIFLPAILILISCAENEIQSAKKIDTNTYNEHVKISDTIPTFESVQSNFNGRDLILPKGFTYTVLFSEGDDVTREDGKKFPAKGNHDLSVFIPNEEYPNSKGILYISHETKHKDENLGDGGGATIFDIEKINNKWQVIGD